ncbi:hypothetical protein [Streptomyces roseifaciens]|uniref:hypothetical protein n=1 Tax=Streptomyces roseifaciens TaxID=1488406 RepID=UPI00136667DB|nr:hypothetical protein [Streptomyces roseifaciens]
MRQTDFAVTAFARASASLAGAGAAEDGSQQAQDAPTAAVHENRLFVMHRH